MPEVFRILFVHDDPAIRALASEALQNEFPDTSLTSVADAATLDRALHSDPYDMAVTDYSLRWGEGPAVYQSIKNRWPECPVVVFSVTGEDAAALRSMAASPEASAAGWPQFLTLLLVAVRAAIDKTRLERERRAANERLRESEARFRSVFESATDAIILADPEGFVVSWNRAAEGTFGYGASEVLGRPLSMLLPEWDRSRREEGTPPSRRGGPGRVVGHAVEMRGRRKDGTEFPIELAVGSWETERGRFFSGVIRDITRRKADQEQLQRYNEQLRDLSARIEAVQEFERAGIARELHDELGQAMTALRFDIRWLEKRLEERRLDRDACQSRIGRMTETIDATIESIRRISAELRPGVLDQLGLTAALERQVQEFSDRTGIPCELQSTLGDRSVPREIGIAMYRVVQECLTNVARHARARRVQVSLTESDGTVFLRVQDDGKGIDDAEIASPHSLGILGMKERCRSLSGELVVSGAPGRGTLVAVRIPGLEPAPSPPGPRTRTGEPRPTRDRPAPTVTEAAR